MIPFLLQGLSYDDKAENAKRLRLLNDLGYPDIKDVVNKVLDSSSPTLLAEAIVILAENIENEDQIIQLADNKDKHVKEAAINALVKLNTHKSFEKLKDIYIKSRNNKSNLELLVSVLSPIKLPFFFSEIFKEVVDSYKRVVNLDAGATDRTVDNTFEKFALNLGVLQNEDRPEVLEFLEEVIANNQLYDLMHEKRSILRLLSEWAIAQIAKYLDTLDQSDVIAFYEKNIDNIPDNEWKKIFLNNYFTRVKKVYTPEKVFDLFGSLFNPYPNFSKEKSVNVEALLDICSDVNFNDPEVKNDVEIYIEKIYIEKIDQRWTPLLFHYFDNIDKRWSWRWVHHHALLLLNALEPKSEKLDKLLIDLSKKNDESDLVTVNQLISLRKIES